MPGRLPDPSFGACDEKVVLTPMSLPRHMLASARLPILLAHWCMGQIWSARRRRCLAARCGGRPAGGLWGGSRSAESRSRSGRSRRDCDRLFARRSSTRRSSPAAIAAISAPRLSVF